MSTPGEYLLKGRKVLDSYVRFQMSLGFNITEQLRFQDNAKLTVRLKSGRRGEYEAMVSILPPQASGWISDKLNFRRPGAVFRKGSVDDWYTREDIAYLRSMFITVPLDNDTTDAII